MERSEPALAPEWLKGTNGGVNGGGSSASHHFPSTLQSDDHAIALPTRSRSLAGSADRESTRSFTDRTSSSYFRRSSSSNGGIIHEKDSYVHSRSYSSFSRIHRDKNWEKEFDFGLGDHGIHDHSDTLTNSNVFTGKNEKDSLRRSQSMIPGKGGEIHSKRIGSDTNNSLHIAGSISSNINKASFERDFPLLGAEDKQGIPDITRVSSPVLRSISPNLPMGNSAVIGGDSWTSALVEIPAIVGSNSAAPPSIQQTLHASSTSVLPSMSTGLNMAETLAQAPSRARTVPQLSVETQRLEEFAIKQSRQLIPMTPMPKASVLSSSEKTKPKGARTGELSALTKFGQQSSSSQLVNLAARGPARSDASKTSQVGKLLILKAARENNGSSPTAKDISTPISACQASLGVATPPSIVPSRIPNSTRQVTDRKGTLVVQSSLERRHPCQAQNRSDFFNSLRKKTSGNHSAHISDASPAVAPTIIDKSDEQITVMAASASHDKEKDEPPPTDCCLGCSTEAGGDTIGNCDANEECKISTSDAVDPDVDPDAVVDPHEAAFLRSLGWEPGGEALTEKEISDFFESIKLKQANTEPVLPEPLADSLGSASAPSSSDSEIET